MCGTRPVFFPPSIILAAQPGDFQGDWGLRGLWHHTDLIRGDEGVQMSRLNPAWGWPSPPEDPQRVWRCFPRSGSQGKDGFWGEQGLGVVVEWQGERSGRLQLHSYSMFLSSMGNVGDPLMCWDPRGPKESWNLAFSPPILPFGMDSLMEELVSFYPSILLPSPSLLLITSPLRDKPNPKGS